MKIINFIKYFDYYHKIIDSITDPIKLHLLDSITSYSEALDNAVNIHFFLEQYYRNDVNIHSGTSVFLSHGISDKNRKNGGFVKAFDYICVPGPLWEEKLLKEGLSQEKILMVGYPKLDPIFQGKIKRKSSDKKRILWAPTHYGSPSSYPDLLNDLKNFPRDIELIISLHPFCKESKIPTIEELVNADAVISDSGSIIYESLALEKPVIFPDWLVKEKILKYPNTFEGKIYSKPIGLHANNFNELINKVYYALENGIDDKSKEFIEGIFPTKLRGNSGKVLADKLIDISLY